jgi:hypothetical protein
MVTKITQALNSSKAPIKQNKRQQYRLMYLVINKYFTKAFERELIIFESLC